MLQGSAARPPLHPHHPHHKTAGDARLRQWGMLARRLAPWLALGLVGLLLLLLSQASGPGQSGAAILREPDIKLELGPYFFNPSIVRHRGVYLATARTAHMKRIDKVNWWFNEGYICISTTPDFKTVSCRKFDPWQG
jgi:hypothetical protein